MAKAFWTIVGNAGDGTTGNPNRPNLPALPSLAVVNPLDIWRLPAGAGAAAHVHLLVGNLAVMSDQAGGGHEHYVTDAGNTILRGAATAHTHANPTSPDFFLCLVRCSNADALTLVSSPNNVKPLVGCTVDADGFSTGLDPTLWNDASPTDYLQDTFWKNRALNFLGLQLPPAVNSGAKAFQVLVGMLRSRRDVDDSGLRG
jgi:hypothetical protein